MNNWQEFLEYVAYAVAAILAGLGARRLLLHSCGKNGPQGGFLALIGFFLLLQGASGAEEKAIAEKPKSSEPSKEATTQDSAALPIPPELAKDGKWQAFKKLWKQLDEVMPRPPHLHKNREDMLLPEFAKGVHPPEFANRKYYSALPPAKAVAMLNELATTFNLPNHRWEEKGVSNVRAAIILLDTDLTEIADKSGVSPIAAMLIALTERRICAMGMPYLIHPLTRTHYWSSWYTDSGNSLRYSALDQLECQIDTLLALREKKSLDDASVRAALDRISNDVYYELLLSTFINNRFVPDSLAEPETRMAARMEAPIQPRAQLLSAIRRVAYASPQATPQDEERLVNLIKADENYKKGELRRTANESQRVAHQATQAEQHGSIPKKIKMVEPDPRTIKNIEEQAATLRKEITTLRENRAPLDRLLRALEE